MTLTIWSWLLEPAPPPPHAYVLDKPPWPLVNSKLAWSALPVRSHEPDTQSTFVS